MAIRPVYRLTVQAPSSEDPTEATVLTPIAGAAHADPFRVATTDAMMAPATNLVLRSQEFDNATWLKVSDGAGAAPAVTANAAAAPDGTLSADRVVFAAPSPGDQSSVSQDGTAAVVAGAAYAGSIFVKAAGGGDVGKTLLLRHVGRATYTAHVLTAEWQRVQAPGVAALANNYFEIGLRPDQGGSSGTVTALLWGAQLQAGAVSDYVPTVATIATREAFQPYLGWPTGRQGSLDYTTKRTTTGNLKLPIADFRTVPGGDNAVRWVTAFLGDAFGRTRFKGCKFQLERSLDGGNLFIPFSAGRVRNTGQSRALWHELDVKDFADDLNRPLFKGAPHPSITYAALSPLLPNGLVKPYGNCALTPPLAATLGAPFSTAPDTVVVNITTANVPEAMITQAVLDSNSSTALRVVELTKVADGTKHYYQWPRGDSALASQNIPGGPTGHPGLLAFPISMLPEGDVRREALPAVGIAVTVSIVLDAPPTEATPLLVNDVQVIQYIADILDGKFSLGPGETTLRPLAERNTDPGNSWDALLADPSFGTMRDVITKLEPKANDYLEKAILQRHNLALVRDGRGRVDIVDLRRKPTLAGVVTLTDDDLVNAEEPAWDDSRDGAVTAVVIDYYIDQQIPLSDLVASADTFPTLPSARIRSTKSSILKVNDLSTFKDVGEKIVTIAARGDRISSGDLLSAHFGRQRRDLVEAKLTAAAIDFLRPIGSGIITAKATYRLASANAAQISVGKYFIVQHSKLPDPASNERGGARLMLCLSCDERDGALAVQWMDAGTGAVAVVPNITAVASANPYSIDVTVAANGDGDPIEIHVAVTETSVAVRPADDAAEWLFAVQTAAGTVHVANLAPTKRVWTRARSYGTAANMKLPSAWDYAPAPGYLDLAAGDAVDGSQPDPSWEPIATTGDIISPPSCYALENPIRSTRTTANIFLGGAVGDGSATPLSWRYTVGNGAPSAWSTAPIAGVSINVTRDKFYPTDVVIEVTQPDGQSARYIYAVGPNPLALDPGSGQVDPTQPLAGTSHFIPRATDVNGFILDPNTKDSRSAPLSGMFRYGTDTAAGVMETAGLSFTDPSYLSGRKPAVLYDPAAAATIGAGAVRDAYARAVNVIAGSYDGSLLSGAKDSRAAPLNGMGRTGVDSIASWLDGGGYAKTTTAEKGGAGRAVAALDSGSMLVTGVRPMATVGDQSAARLAASRGAFFVDPFDVLPGSDNSGWNAVGTFSLVPNAGSTMGPNFARSQGFGQYNHKTYLPFNPNKLYRVRCRVRLALHNTVGSELFYIGLTARDAAGAPANNNGGACYVCAAGVTPGGNIWTEYVGWFKGATAPYTSPVFTPSADPAAPEALNVNTVEISPLIYAGYSGSGGLFDVDYYLIDEFDEDGTFRTYSGFSPGGDVKGQMYTPNGSRQIVRGGRQYPCRHGDAVVFPATVNLPAVIIEGGVSQQPESKWGTAAQVDAGVGATNPPTAGKAQYRDFAPLNLTNSSFSVRGRLRIKAAAALVNYDYAANSVNAVNGDTGAVTLAAGPASDGRYTTRYDITVNCTCLGTSGSATFTVDIAIEVDDGSGSGLFIERLTVSYQCTANAGDGPQTNVNNNQSATVSATVTGTAGRIRIRAKSAVFSGVKGNGNFTLHGHTASDSTRGVTYNSAGGDLFTSASPDVDDAQALTYTVVEI